MSTPRAEVIERTGRGTGSRQDDEGAAAWSDVGERWRCGTGTSWLSVRGRDGGVHTRPVFAAWTGGSLVFATSPGAAKTAHLRADGRVSIAVDLGTLHLVAEGPAARSTSPDGLRRASAAMADVFDWPTEVVGDQLDAPYSAPTSGGPPFEAWEMLPATVHVFPTQDQVAPTRFLFD